MRPSTLFSVPGSTRPHNRNSPIQQAARRACVAPQVLALEPRVLFSAGALHAHVHPPHPHPAAHATHVLFGAKPQAGTLAAPSSLAASLSGTNTAQLKWTDNCTSASGYTVLRSTDGGSFSKIVNIGSSTASSYSDSNLAAGHTYTYEVEAYNGKQTTSVSNKSSVTVVPTAPSAPTGVT